MTPAPLTRWRRRRSRKQTPPLPLRSLPTAHGKRRRIGYAIHPTGRPPRHPGIAPRLVGPRRRAAVLLRRRLYLGGAHELHHHHRSHDDDRARILRTFAGYLDTGEGPRPLDLAPYPLAIAGAILDHLEATTPTENWTKRWRLGDLRHQLDR